MDAIAELLAQWADRATGGQWTLTNTSVIVRIEATSAESFDTAQGAFDEALNLLSEVTGLGYLPVNNAKISAHSEPMYQQDARWRGVLHVAVQRTAAMNDESHIPIPL